MNLFTHSKGAVEKAQFCHCYESPRCHPEGRMTEGSCAKRICQRQDTSHCSV